MLRQAKKNARFYLRLIQVGSLQSAAQCHLVITPIQDTANMLLARLTLCLPGLTQASQEQPRKQKVTADEFHGFPTRVRPFRLKEFNPFVPPSRGSVPH